MLLWFCCPPSSTYDSFKIVLRKDPRAIVVPFDNVMGGFPTYNSAGSAGGRLDVIPRLGSLSQEEHQSGKRILELWYSLRYRDISYPHQPAATVNR